MVNTYDLPMTIRLLVNNISNYLLMRHYSPKSTTLNDFKLCAAFSIF